MEPRAISLFSGAGGLDTGFEQAGYQIIFANEIDHDAAQAWRDNRPDNASAMREGDIKDYMPCLNTHNLQNIDIVFGGPPCQGFSVAGKMNPDDPRSRMVWRFLDVVAAVSPRVFVMENVAALGRLGKWDNVRKRIISRAKELGYHTEYKVWRTADFGVPQKRERVIFVGVKDGNPSLFEKEMVHHHASAPTARQVLLSVGKYGTADNPQTCTSRVSLAHHPVMRNSPYAGMLVNGAGRPVNLDGLPPTLPATMGGNKTPVIDQAALDNPGIQNWFVGYHSRLMNGGTPGGSVPSTLRRLTLKEAAAIQTFPPEYKFSGAKSKQYRQIGNAVPCLFARAVAESVKDAYL